MSRGHGFPFCICSVSVHFLWIDQNFMSFNRRLAVSFFSLQCFDAVGLAAGRVSGL